jgi:hypothetical protein
MTSSVQSLVPPPGALFGDESQLLEYSKYDTSPVLANCNTTNATRSNVLRFILCSIYLFLVCSQWFLAHVTHPLLKWGDLL